jgi:hypothetical protein
VPWVRNLIETNIRRFAAALWSLRVTKYDLLSICYDNASPALARLTGRFTRPL